MHPFLKPYARRVSVFGSFARGDETPQSDIDLLLALKPEGQRPSLGLFEVIRLENELEKHLGRCVDLVTEEGISPRIKASVDKEKVILYEENWRYCAIIYDAICTIETYNAGVNKMAFLANGMMQDAIMRPIEIIGEAVARISYELQEKHPDLPWLEMRAIRNKIVHDYLEINTDIIWDTVKNDLPSLKTQIKKLLGE